MRPAALFAAIAALMIAGHALAADPVNIEIMAVEEEPGRMVLTISAINDKGRPFHGLDPSSFNAWINGQPLIVKELQSETSRQPASVLLLVDVSSSMAGEPIEQARVAIREFISVLEGSDEVALMTFSQEVKLVQDFTSDRELLESAVASFELTNDTALYDGVIEAAAKMGQSNGGRKLVVLLSDGQATVGQEKRDASIESARAAGVGVVAVGLGSGTDRAYLDELTSGTGGRLLEAATPAELRQAYTDLAYAIRSQYTLVTEVPRSIDRTVPGTLKVHVIHRADSDFAERPLDPLPGAVPPPFSMELDGLQPGDKPEGTVMLVPTVQDGIEVVKMDYFLDDDVIHSAQGVNSFALDAAELAEGSHVLKVVATDAQGREGEVQVPFVVPAVAPASGGFSPPVLPLGILAGVLAVGLLLFKLIRKRLMSSEAPPLYETRVRDWASLRTSTSGQRPEEWSSQEAVAPDLEQKAEPVTGRIVIMDESAVRGGDLDMLREFEMRSSPVTLGSGPQADITVGDAGGMIAAEEARLWVQRGRLVYHKLTTLSAMATEGMTAGWQFLEDGDEMRIGPYRLIFRLGEADGSEEPVAAPQVPQPRYQEPAVRPSSAPQEHGMALYQGSNLPLIEEEDWAEPRLENHDAEEASPWHDTGAAHEKNGTSFDSGGLGAEEPSHARDPDSRWATTPEDLARQGWQPSSPDQAAGWAGGMAERDASQQDSSGMQRQDSLPRPGGLQPNGAAGDWNSFVSGGDYEPDFDDYDDEEDEA